MTQANQYQLGLDIGIASVGWAVLGELRIIATGVRTFDAAEDEKGNPLNQIRRQARLTRTRLQRRSWRLLKLARLMRQHGLLDSGNFFRQQRPCAAANLWLWRVEGLSRRLDKEEWARVIYHLCKHRGFWFASKAEAAQSEGGKVKKALNQTRQRMVEGEHATVACLLLASLPDGKQPANQRNKAGDYGLSVPRELLAEELALLFARQRELGNDYASEALEEAVLAPEHGLFWLQKPALSGDAILSMLGHCTFEPAEERAAKHSWSAERFVWLTRLNNLRISIDGASRPLDDAERDVVLNLPYQLAKVSYRQLKDALVKVGRIPEEARFAGLDYRKPGKSPEDAPLIELKGYHTLRKAVEGAGLKAQWPQLAAQPALLDEIATTLTCCKTDADRLPRLAAAGLAQPLIDALLEVSFSQFIRLSAKALDKILPHMLCGQRYDQACLCAGYHHSQPQQTEARRFLPPLDDNAPRNPVVQRALHQSIKVVNAIIARYGAPQRVHIEMARDLSRSLDERKAISREQQAYAERNRSARDELARHLERSATGKEFDKWLLYREQDGQCLYSGLPLDLASLLNDANYAQIDHALPYSRSFDDSRNNRVLVLTRENQNKGNRTPYEYLDGANNSPAWREFVARVSGNPKLRQTKRDRLLRQHFGKDESREFKARHLQDTRYACRYFKQFVESHLALHEDSEWQRVVVVSGQLTAFLRARWGLTKLREGSDRHHAADALIVAACDHGMVKRLADYARRKELALVRQGFADAETGEVVDIHALRQLENAFPLPWPHFAQEVCLRVGLVRQSGAVDDSHGSEDWRMLLQAIGYDAALAAATRPLFVSRAVTRRQGGAAHKDTIYALRPTPVLPQRVTQKVSLGSLSLADIDKLIEPERNARLYAALRERLLAFKGDGKKAFAQPFYKPGKDDQPGPVVRSVTKVIDKQTGIPVRGGQAINDSMLRVDVFSRSGKYYLVPVYVHHRAQWQKDGSLPMRAITRDRDENDWRVMDENYQFEFSLYPNDLCEVQASNNSVDLGYFAGCDRSNGRLNLWAHDRNRQIGKGGLLRTVTTTAKRISKFHVDALGQVYQAAKEKRGGLA